MRDMRFNYETLVRISKAMSGSRDPEQIIHMAVQSTKEALGVKGCALFLIDQRTDELEIAASAGLSDDYLNKGPVSALKSIAESLREGPVAISDVTDDPRIQYPEAAQSEGIASILSVPIMIGEKAIGAIRVYTAEQCEFSMDDVNFVQALAQIAGTLLEMSRLYQGQKQYIEVLTTMQEAREM